MIGIRICLKTIIGNIHTENALAELSKLIVLQELSWFVKIHHL